jgi:hypothetical protein
MATQTEMATLCLLAEAYAGQTMVCESQSFPQLHVLKFWVLEIRGMEDRSRSTSLPQTA